MKRSLDFLDRDKRTELKFIVDNIIKEVPETEMVILYGSYARNDFVEYDQRREYDINTYYQSDYDILVVTNNQPTGYGEVMRKLEKVEEVFYKGRHSSRVKPIQFIVESFDKFNNAVVIGQYFYRDIKRDGIMLYDSGKFKISRQKKQNYSDKLLLAKEYYNERITTGEDFLDAAKYFLKKKKYKMASYQLNQAAENLLFGTILIHTLYAPKEHNIGKMFESVKDSTFELIQVFPRDTPEEKRLFRLLEDAYIHARFNPKFEVIQEDIEKLIVKVNKLEKVSKKICVNRIEEYRQKIRQKK